MSTEVKITPKKSTPARRLENGRDLAVEMEDRILLALSKFGWLSIAHVKDLFWPQSKWPRMAQRTLARLAKEGYVLEQKVVGGTKLFALSHAGATRVQAPTWVANESRRSFFSVARSHMSHRSLANDVCIYWLRTYAEQSMGYYPEHQIQARKSPLNQFEGYLCAKRPKIPDALLVACSGEELAEKDPFTWLYWVEVERGERNKSDQEHMVQALVSLVGYKESDYETRWQGTNYRVKGALVVCPEDRFANRLVNDLKRFFKKEQDASRHTYSYMKTFQGIFIWQPGGKFITLEQWAAKMEEERLAGIRKKVSIAAKPLA